MQIYLRLIDYNNKVLCNSGSNESILTVSNNTAIDGKLSQFLSIVDYSTTVEQTLNIGSQSTGAGAGKITFNPFRITKHLDTFSPVLFQNAASGTPFKTAEIFFVSPQNLLVGKQTFKMVAVKTVSWSYLDEGIVEIVTFEYGGLFLTVNQQGPDGNIKSTSQSGWNRIRNVVDLDINSEIK